MKLARIGLITLLLAVLCSVCPAIQADDDEAEVDLKVEVVSPLSVTTNEARPVTTRWAVLHGSLTDLGTASSVDVYFEWGETTDYGHKTRPRTMTKPRAFRAIIWGLTPATTYHFRAVAVGDDTSYGSDKSFTTRGRWWWWKWWWK